MQRCRAVVLAIAHTANRTAAWGATHILCNSQTLRRKLKARIRLFLARDKPCDSHHFAPDTWVQDQTRKNLGTRRRSEVQRWSRWWRERGARVQGNTRKTHTHTTHPNEVNREAMDIAQVADCNVHTVASREKNPRCFKQDDALGISLFRFFFRALSLAASGYIF